MNITGKNWGGKGGGLPRFSVKNKDSFDFPLRGPTMDTAKGGQTNQSLGNYSKLTPMSAPPASLGKMADRGPQVIPALTRPYGK